MNTQANEILELIKRNNSVGTENWKLSEISLKYSSRISELRQKGHDIYATRDKVNGRSTGTWRYFIRVPEPVIEKPEAENTQLFDTRPERKFY